MKGKICYYADRNKKICGYQYKRFDKDLGKICSKSFSIKNYGSLEKAKEAAEEYRNSQPVYKKEKKNRNEKISCECGVELRIDSMRRHLDTKYHQFYITLRDFINS